MKCRYCDVEVIGKKQADICPTCKSKLPTVRKFVAECERFKRRIGYYEIRGVQKNGSD